MTGLKVRAKEGACGGAGQIHRFFVALTPSTALREGSSKRG
jgi:hypothetical protein